MYLIRFLAIALVLTSNLSCTAQVDEEVGTVELQPGEFLPLTANHIASINLANPSKEQNNRQWNKDRIEYSDFNNYRRILPYGNHYCRFRPRVPPAGIVKHVRLPLMVCVELCPDAKSTNYGANPVGVLATNYRISELHAKSGGVSAGLEIGLYGKTFVASDNGLLLVKHKTPGKEASTFFSLAVSDDQELFPKVIARSKLTFSAFRDLENKEWIILCRNHGDGIEIQQFGTSLDLKTLDLVPKLPVHTYYRKVGERHKVSHLSFKIAEIVKNEKSLSWVNISEPELDPPWTFGTPKEAPQRK